MYFFEQFDESEHEGIKVFLDDNNDPNNEDQLNGFNENYMDDNKVDYHDLYITQEDNNQRFLIPKEKQNKADNNQISTTIYSNARIINGKEQNLERTETPKTSPIESNIPTTKNMENSRKIFNISKINKKVGRMLKALKRKFKAAHNKYSEDNIIRKFKARFQDILLNYINYEYSEFLISNGKSKKVKLLQRINPAESRKIGRADNLRWFSTKLKALFSSELSQKCSLYDSNYNKHTIENLYKNNEALNVIDTLEKDVIDMYNLYRNNVKIDGFTTLEEDLKILREKMEKENEESEEEEDIELYLSNYRNIAKNLYEIFDKKKGRNRKSKKISL